jgi:hypothetical protein
MLNSTWAGFAKECFMLFSWVLYCLPVDSGAGGCNPREKMQLMQLMLLMQLFPTAPVASTTQKKNLIF